MPMIICIGGLISQGYFILNQKHGLFSFLLFGMFFSFIAAADTFPPDWDNGSGAAIHHAPVSWPSEPVDAADCGDNCGQWKPYTRFQNSVNDPRAQDDSNGGTAPQNYVNIASSCTDKNLPSIYYYLHQGATAADDVIMFRWRVEQIANTYATGPNAGAFSASNPWSSALWTVLFDIDGSGYRSLAAHLNGSSGGPGEAIDLLAGIWSQSPKQSIDYINDPSVHILGHNPTAFIDPGSSKILNFQNSVTPVANWPNGSSETSWDYGTSRAKLVTTRSCNEYFVDYQIPVAMLDATALGGPEITRSTPISMMFCTANSLNNPFQKDCAINTTWAAESNKPAPFGDYISFDKTEPYSQPIVAEVKAIAPSTCGQDYELTARVQDVLAIVNGEVVTSVKSLDFYYWYDANGSGDADEVGGMWEYAASATQTSGSLNTWTANWNASSLPKGKYLIGVQAVDDNTLVDDGMTPTGVDNRTFSYVAGDAESQVYIDGAWITGQQAIFPTHNPGQTPSNVENWFGNPEVTGIQTALLGVALNTCGVAPTIGISVSESEVAPSAAVTFTVTVDNAGNSEAITVSNLSNQLPDGFSYQNNSTSGDFGTANPTISSRTLSWNFGTPVTIAANGNAALIFIATASTDAGNYNNTATAATSFGDLASAPIAISVGSARLALNITPDTNSTSPSGQVTYTLNYSNPSLVAVDGATLSSTLPADTSFQSCSDSCSNGGGTVSWSLGTLAPGSSGSVTLVLDISASYASNSLATAVSLSGTDPATNPVSASAQSSIYVNVPVGAIAAFTLDKTASAVQIAPGENVTYTIAYENFGGASASNVVITDSLPAGMAYVSSTASGVESGGTVTWNVGTIAASGTGSVTVTVAADNPFEAPNPSSNSAQINWDGGTQVRASVDVGVTGLSCSTYYFRESTTDVGFDGTDRIATNLPVPVSGDTGSTVSVIAPVSGSAYLEAIRFYQDPAGVADIDFSGTVDSWVYIDRINGQGLNLQATLYDYNSTNGNLTQLGQQVTLFNGSTKGRLDFSVPVTGTLQKDHRLLWVIDVRSNHASQTVDVEIQYNGTVTNGISGGTTFADSGASFCVTPPANLSIDKTVDLATVPESTTTPVVYTINYSNLGASQATNAAIVDTLPAGVSFVSATLNGSSNTPTGTNPYTFTVGTVAAGANGTLLINASVSNTATGLLTNSASLSSDQTSAVVDTTSTLVGAPVSGGGSTAPELYMSKSADTNLLGAGDAVTYILTVVNAGSADATNVVVTDDFPEQSYFSYVSCNTATGTCNESPSGTLSWDVGTLAAGGSATLSYQLQVATTGIPNGLSLLNNSSVASDDDYCTGALPASCSSETVTVSVSGNPELALVLTADNASVIPGDVIEYSLVVSNNGSSTANNIVVANPIPDSTRFVEITLGSGSFDTINNQVIFPIASLAAGASASHSFTVQVLTPLPSGATTVTDTATVSAANAASVTDTVSSTATSAAVISLSLSGPDSVPLPATILSANVSNSTLLSVKSTSLLSPGDDIRVNGTFTEITTIAGSLLTVSSPVTATSGDGIQLAGKYSITYQNSGDAAATNVQISEPLPAGWLFVSASPAATSSPAIGNNGTVSWTIGTVDAGESGTLQFVALPTASGSALHAATLTGDNAINEVANVTSLVGGLTVHKTTASSSAAPGGNVTYSITVSNSLAVPVTGVQVKDVLPTGFTYASSTVAPDSFDSGDTSRPIWNVDVPANNSVSIDLTANISSDAGPATYQNEVSVVAPAGVGVAKFDALATKSEDVTLLVSTGLMSGDVFYENAPLSGVWVNFYDDNVLAYRTYTDGAGHFERVVEAGSNWRMEISSDADNSALLAGLSLTSGSDPESFSISASESLSRTLVYSLAAPTVNSLLTSDTTPVITGTYPSTAVGGVFTVTVNGVTYSLGADLVATGDNWTLTIPLSDLLADGTYDVTATIVAGSNNSTDTTSSELVIDATDTDADGILDLQDLDDDNDGIPDVLEGDGSIDTDGDGIADSLDLDSDNDGLFDLVESGAGNISTIDADNDGQIDSGNSVGSNGIADVIETTADSSTVNYNGGVAIDTDGDGIADFRDQDSDGDGLYDLIEAGGTDADNNGLVDGFTDANSDGLDDTIAVTPLPIPDTDNDGVADWRDLDSDNDGITDVVESGGLDPDGDGRVGDSPQTVDANGVYTGGALTPLDTDGDGVPNQHDLDSDNDGIPDVIEGGGSDPDGDGVIGTGTPTVNAQGIANGIILNPANTDGVGLSDPYDLDSDGDGIFDLIEAGGVDVDNDGLVDGFVDSDGDGYDDFIKASPLPLPDTDGDGTPDYQDINDVDNDGIQDANDIDDDNDGIPDSIEGNGLVDTDGDGVADSRDLDSDNDGLFDVTESGVSNSSSLDVDNDGRIDNANNVGSNGLADIVETSVDSGALNYNGGIVIDTDTDGIPDFRDVDSDNDGIMDVIESGGADPDGDGVIGTGAPTVNIDGLATGSGLMPDDLDGNGIADYKEVAATNDVIRTGLNGTGAFDIWLIVFLSLLLLGQRLQKRKTMLLGLLLVLCSSANGGENQNEPETKHVYIGLGAGFSIMAPETDGTIYSIDDDQDFGYKIYIGTEFNEHLSLEFGTSDLGKTTLKPAGSIDYSISMLNVLYHFYDQGKNDHKGWGSYIKGGLGFIQNSASVPHEKVNSTQIALGAGVEYGWDNGFSVRLDAESFDDDAALVTLGLLYRFANKKSPQPKPQPEPEPQPQSKPQPIPQPKDNDGDGVFDAQDKCVDTPSGTIVDALGCELDSDKDGVVDGKDQCPSSAANAKVDALGCVNDIDGDGVLNKTDKCPDTIKGAEVNAAGCAIFETKIEGVNFKVASAELTVNSKIILNHAADALVKFKTVRIEIQAHTDSQGKEAANQLLSDARAKSVRDYLESAGVSGDRMKVKGYGETKPLASNKTREGRAKNRRVEFRVLEAGLNGK